MPLRAFCLRPGVTATNVAALALALSLSLSTTPALAAGAPAADDSAEAEPADPELEPGESDAGEPESDADQPEPADVPQPEVTQIEPADAPTGGGVAGSIVDPDDPNATRAQSDLEGESLDTQLEGVPDRLPRLQTAGWWTTFAAVALATTGGIFAGVAETRQDEAERLAYGFDLDTGRAKLYADVADDYETLLREGETYQWVARGFIIAGGVTLVAGVTLFAIEGSRRRRAERGAASARLQLDPSPTGLRLRF